MSIDGLNISLFIIIMTLCSLSIFCSQVFKKRFEEVIPVTIMGIIFILYVFGLFEILKIGVYAILLISIFLYLYTFLSVIIKKSWKELCKNTFTPGFVIFMIFFVILVKIHKGRLLISWDEFSFWGDSIKAMYDINDFVTNPASGCAFKSYPPAMALFQYFWQVLAGSFNEGLLFASYQLVAVSLFLPFLKKLKFNEFLKALIILLIIIISPAIFFSKYYTVVFIDPILGLVFGFGLATVFVEKEYDLLTSITLFLVTFMLVLLKPVGAYLALIIFFIVSIDVLFIKKYLVKIIINKDFKENLKKSFVVFLILFSILFAKNSWTYEIKSNNVYEAFSKPVVMSELINILAGNDTTYKSGVVDNFINGIHTQVLTPVFQPLTFFSASAIFIILFFYFYKKTENKKKTKLIIITVLLGNVIYVFGLLVLYLFRFSYIEAAGLASFNRYLNIYFAGMLMFSALKILSDSSKESGVKYGLIFLLAFLLINFESNGIIKLFYRSTDHSIATRQPFTDAANKFTGLVGKEKHTVYVISQNDLTGGLSYWILRYSLRPHTTNPNFSWSIGTPYGAKDHWTRKINPDKWMDELVAGYEYVLIYNCDEQFIQEFGKLFKNGGVMLKDFIKNRAVYKVNIKNRCLELVG